MTDLIRKLYETQTLEKDELISLLNCSADDAEELRRLAEQRRIESYGRDIFIRGLIEFTNICRQDCYYCGIRKSNKNCERYRLSGEEILACCDEGYDLGFRTFVLQGGEDGYFTDEKICGLIESIKKAHPDCALTLSIGEKSRESYKRFFDCGADRYLLRHETADKEHFSKLHPEGQSFENRMRCLYDLKDIGYQVGCGFMVGSPYQTDECLAKDLLFIKKFNPQMIGIGPFIRHKDTKFKDFPDGTLEMTLRLLSIIRLMLPKVLLPATTALATIDPRGREKGILAGANVVMPNLSPVRFRKAYSLYDNKVCTGEESAECKNCLSRRIESIGCRIAVSRGDSLNTGNR
ncbi:MAG: [Ruminococcus sp.]|nr:[FeFe] hydrogenase H-cluster radical SAM maturase HydE [Ruminococcus sp.]